MKLYTKTGDKGETALFGGARVPKDHVRIEAYGTVDELNSWIGLIRDEQKDSNTQKNLIDIQDRLFTIGSILATDSSKKNLKVPPLKSEDIERLENYIDEIDSQLEPMKSFVLPGGNTKVSNCHIARCVCRRAERRSISLDHLEKIDPKTYQYLNRLSDYLFILSRKIAKEESADEVPWVPKYE